MAFWQPDTTAVQAKVTTMKKIAVLTSGGDAPGMNAAIRAVVRSGIARGVEVFGVKRGYAGLIEDNMQLLEARSVGGIIQQGGTILGSARSLEFKTPEGRERALSNLRARGIEGLVVIGGNGSQTGASALNDMGFPVIGVASTIDNDLIGSDITIGVDTALNIALEAIDRLKVTASSHQRAFLVEVMGRDCGYLALMAASPAERKPFSSPKIRPNPVGRITCARCCAPGAQPDGAKALLSSPRGRATVMAIRSQPTMSGGCWRSAWVKMRASQSWGMCSAAEHRAPSTAG